MSQSTSPTPQSIHIEDWANLSEERFDRCGYWVWNLAFWSFKGSFSTDSGRFDACYYRY
jgi:hypothetical protein